MGDKENAITNDVRSQSLSLTDECESVPFGIIFLPIKQRGMLRRRFRKRTEKPSNQPYCVGALAASSDTTSVLRIDHPMTSFFSLFALSCLPKAASRLPSGFDARRPTIRLLIGRARAPFMLTPNQALVRLIIVLQSVYRGSSHSEA